MVLGVRWWFRMIQDDDTEWWSMMMSHDYDPGWWFRLMSQDDGWWVRMVQGGSQFSHRHQKIKKGRRNSKKKNTKILSDNGGYDDKRVVGGPFVTVLFVVRWSTMVPWRDGEYFWRLASIRCHTFRRRRCVDAQPPTHLVLHKDEPIDGVGRFACRKRQPTNSKNHPRFVLLCSSIHVAVVLVPSKSLQWCLWRLDV